MLDTTTQANTIYVNKTSTLLQTTGGKDEPNIFLYVEIVTDITTQNSERQDTFIVKLGMNRTT